MTRKVKGMVQLEGITYRIVRVNTGSYSVIRIRDDQEVGGFQTAPALNVRARSIDPVLLREIARVAIHTAKTSYAAFPAQGVGEAPKPAASAPSSVPPALPPT
ncbi:MAG TPA: hypothetical protein VHV51_14785 [Polyangiaceae bacterium]|jgi:hypothetical protein|nr:hypothetical protein [Polyangiaceae bacterium]